MICLCFWFAFFLIIINVEHLFLCSLAICVSLGEMFIQGLCTHDLFLLLLLLLLSLGIFKKYILSINIVSDTWFLCLFLPSMGCFSLR